MKKPLQNCMPHGKVFLHRLDHENDREMVDFLRGKDSGKVKKTDADIMNQTPICTLLACPVTGSDITDLSQPNKA